MPSRLSTTLSAAALALLAAARAGAQDAPVSPFRAGQWGAHISMSGLTFRTVDLLKFTSPTRAWVLSASGFANTDHETSSLNDVKVSGENLSLSLQRRFLRATSSHVVLYLSPGILGSYSHGCTTDVTLGTTACVRGWQAGVLAEAGAEYVINSHLGLGARYRASLAYSRSDFFGSNRLWSIDTSLGDAGVFGAVFF